MGVRVVHTKRNPELLATWGLRTLIALGGVAGAALFAFGLWHMRTAGVGSRYMVCVFVGVLGVLDSMGGFRFLANPRPTPMAWWYKHMECMLACGIGFHTAFLVFGAGRLIPLEWLPGAMRLVPWILPTAIGVPAIVIWVRHYRRKFGELDAANAAKPDQ